MKTVVIAAVYKLCQCGYSIIGVVRSKAIWKVSDVERKCY